MTYCVGILSRDGLVMIADTRTNAGLDNIAVFRKLHITAVPGERCMALATAGNLAITQSVLSILGEGVKHPDSGEVETLESVPNLFRAVQLVGRAIREVYRIDGKAVEDATGRFDVSMLLGGQIAGEHMRLFMIYAAGNFIEASDDTPYLQIGEHKYGKPILDRSVKFTTELTETLKIGLISMDSTLRSNLGVGMPLDILTLPRDTMAGTAHRIEPGEPYFHDLRERWSAALRKARNDIPLPPYLG